jgi:predicted nucleic acid-binding protein
MIIVDTNVLSEPMRRTPERRVMAWIAARPAALLYTTAVTEAEILLGIQLLPKGRRRDALHSAAEAIFDEEFSARVLVFDSAAAVEYAEIVAERKRRGRPIDHIDAQIAAITRAHGATLATRSIADFAHCGIDLIDPWNA